MIRVALVDVLLLLAPSIVYFGYLALRRRGRPTAADVSDAPVLWLMALGVILLTAAIAVLIQMSGGTPTQTYHPPVLKDGVVQPGHLD